MNLICDLSGVVLQRRHFRVHQTVILEGNTSRLPGGLEQAVHTASGHPSLIQSWNCFQQDLFRLAKDSKKNGVAGEEADDDEDDEDEQDRRAVAALHDDDEEDEEDEEAYLIRLANRGVAGEVESEKGEKEENEDPKEQVEEGEQAQEAQDVEKEEKEEKETEEKEKDNLGDAEGGESREEGESQEEEPEGEVFPDPDAVMASTHLLPGEPNPDTREADWTVWFARCQAGSRSYTTANLSYAQKKVHARSDKLNPQPGRRRRRHVPDETQNAQMQASLKLAKSLQIRF